MVSAVMGRLMVCGPIYLGFRGPRLKAVTDMKKSTYRRNQGSLPILVFPPKIRCAFVFLSLEFENLKWCHSSVVCECRLGKN